MANARQLDRLQRVYLPDAGITHCVSSGAAAGELSAQLPRVQVLDLQARARSRTPPLRTSIVRLSRDRAARIGAYRARGRRGTRSMSGAPWSGWARSCRSCAF